jgi:hypothetical protein
MMMQFRQSFDMDPMEGATNQKWAIAVVPFAARPSRFVPPSADLGKAGCPVVGAQPRNEFFVAVLDEYMASTRTRVTKYSLMSIGPYTRLVPMALGYCLNIHRHPPSPKMRKGKYEKSIAC